MDPFTEALLIIKAIESLTATAERLFAAGKATGDPTPEELTQASARATAANQRLHELASA